MGNPRARLWSHVASMDGMNSPDADGHTRLTSATPMTAATHMTSVTPTSSATSTVPQVVKAIAVLAFLPIVRAAFGRFILDLIRRIKPMRSGKHAPEAHPGTMFLGVVASLVVLGLVGLVAWGMCGQAALDWRDGPVTREGVTCTAMNPEERDDGPFVHIELTDTEGIVRAYDLRQYELDRHAAKGTPLYNTIVEACQAPGTQIGISIYDRTGIIVDAWKK